MIKKIVQYILVFILILLILLTLLTLTAMIPREKIINNLQESAKYLETKSGIEKIQNKRDYTYLHTYADSVILNIIYYIDSSKPLQSVLESKYFEFVKVDSNVNFIQALKNNEESNQQYLRYWHGSMIIIRPLLIILNLQQIYYLFAVILYMLLIILFFMLWKKYKLLAIIMVLGMIMINIFITPFCLEYIWTIFIMIIITMLSLKLEKKGNKDLFLLFFISGIITCFLDFLTTELLTILIPILVVLIIRNKENRVSNFKEGLIFICKSIIIWFIGYSAMWISKWVIAEIILNIRCMQDIKNQIFYRINGEINEISNMEMYIGAITKNIHTLFPINIVKRTKKLILPIVIISVTIILLIDKNKIKEKWFSGLLFIIGIIPYIRYLTLSNHSYRHYFFTFRSQLVSIIAIAFAIMYILDNRKIKKIINLKNKIFRRNNG